MRVLIANHDRAGMGIAAAAVPMFQREGHEIDFVLFKKNADRLRNIIAEDNIFAVDEFPPAAAEQFIESRNYGLVVGSLEAAPTDRPAWGAVSKNALAAAQRLKIPSVAYLEALFRPDEIILDGFKNSAGGKIEYIRPNAVAVQTSASLLQVRRLLPELRVVLTGNPAFDELPGRLDKYADPSAAAALARKIAEAYNLDLSRPMVCYVTSSLVNQFCQPEMTILKRAVRECAEPCRKAEAQARINAILEQANSKSRHMYGYADGDISLLIDQAAGFMGAEVQNFLRPHPKEDMEEVKRWSEKKYLFVRDGYEISADEYIDFAALAGLQKLIPGQKINLTTVFANSAMAVDLYIISRGGAKIVTDPPLPAAKASEFLKWQGLIPDIHTPHALAALIKSERRSEEYAALANHILLTENSARRFVKLALRVQGA